MKSILTIALLIFLLNNVNAQISEQAKIDAEKTTHIDTVLRYTGRETTFRGRIYKYEILGDTALMLTCGEIKLTDKKLIVFIKDKKFINNPNNAMLAGMGIKISGLVTLYNGLPSFTYPLSNTITKVMVLPLDRKAITFY